MILYPSSVWRGVIDAARPNAETSLDKRVMVEDISKDDSSSLPRNNEEHDEDSVQLVSCKVNVEGSLPQLREEYRDFVQSFRFDEFEGLSQFMEYHRKDIEKKKTQTMQIVHERFTGVVEAILKSKGLYKSVLGLSDSSIETLTFVVPYASPNVRLRRGGYATFLHSDAVYNAETNSTKAMVNVWLCLNQEPAKNYPLCFYRCAAEQTRHADTKRYAQSQFLTDSKMIFDPNCLSFGYFYCFVAGQQDSAQEVLLHGAVALEEEGMARSYEVQCNMKSHFREEPRKSLEMRYLVYSA